MRVIREKQGRLERATLENEESVHIGKEILDVAGILLVPGSFYGLVRDADIISRSNFPLRRLKYTVASILDSSKAIGYFYLIKYFANQIF